MKKILILANNASGLYDFRNELLVSLLNEYEVHVSLPDESDKPEISKEGCIVHHTDIDRRGVNPFTDYKLIKAYRKLIKEVKPSVVLTYTIKPNIYGNMCCRKLEVPYMANITGLGTAFENKGLLRSIVIMLYKNALKSAECVFFQNEKNRAIFQQFGIKGKKYRMVAGSGVNLSRHNLEEYPSENAPMTFLFVGRIMKEKGIDELLYTASKIKLKYPEIVFQLVGNFEDDYSDIIADYQKQGLVQWIDYQNDVHSFYKSASAVLVPSYHEGMSNVILEAAATGRPVLASRISGCIEGFDEGITGIGFESRNKESMCEAVERFINMSINDRRVMGLKAREKVEREFDRSKVVEVYVNEIKAVMHKSGDK